MLGRYQRFSTSQPGDFCRPPENPGSQCANEQLVCATTLEHDVLFSRTDASFDDLMDIIAVANPSALQQPPLAACGPTAEPPLADSVARAAMREVSSVPVVPSLGTPQAHLTTSIATSSTIAAEELPASLDHHRTAAGPGVFTFNGRISADVLLPMTWTRRVARRLQQHVLGARHSTGSSSISRWKIQKFSRHYPSGMVGRPRSPSSPSRQMYHRLSVVIVELPRALRCWPSILAVQVPLAHFGADAYSHHSAESRHLVKSTARHAPSMGINVD